MARPRIPANVTITINAMNSQSRGDEESERKEHRRDEEHELPPLRILDRHKLAFLAIII